MKRAHILKKITLIYCLREDGDFQRCNESNEIIYVVIDVQIHFHAFQFILNRGCSHEQVLEYTGTRT